MDHEAHKDFDKQFKYGQAFMSWRTTVLLDLHELLFTQSTILLEFSLLQSPPVFS